MLPGNECGNILRKLSVTIYNLQSAADNRGSVKTPCSLNTQALGVKIKLNRILPLVNTRQAYRAHAHPLIGDSRGVCNSHLQRTLAFTTLPTSSQHKFQKTQRNITEQDPFLFRDKFTSDQRKLLVGRSLVEVKEKLIHYINNGLPLGSSYVYL